MNDWAEVKDQIWYHSLKYDEGDPVRALNRLVHKVTPDSPEVTERTWTARRTVLRRAEVEALVRKHARQEPLVRDRPPILVRHAGNTRIVDGTNRINLRLAEGCESVEVIMLEPLPNAVGGGQAQEWQALTKRRLTRRERVQRLIDRLQFLYDMLPGLARQPLPWIGYPTAKGGTDAVERWAAIEKALAGSEPRSALDVGSNVGFFSISLARLGIPVLGVEQDAACVRIARYAARRCRLRELSFAQMTVTPRTIRLLPHADVVLCLGVHHYWSRSFGFAAATEMLSQLWERCAVAMFFDTGEGELPASYNLPPMEPDSREWLAEYLALNCADAEIRHLGTFKTFSPDAAGGPGAIARNLFQIARRPAEAIGDGFEEEALAPSRARRRELTG